MTIQISILDYFQRSFILFFLFFFIFYYTCNKYIDLFLKTIFKIIASKKKNEERQKLYESSKVTFLLVSVLIGAATFIMLTILSYNLFNADTYYAKCWRQVGFDSEECQAYSSYDNFAEKFLPTIFYILFIIICLFPVIYFILLKFKEKFSLVDSLKYTLLTTIIVFITLNILYKVAIFLYYTIGILMGGEQ